jgi:2-deoxystreptamine N-acetyl-D-glucosaminyltransferase/2-deoxystreptamine glucosyltransferase
VPPESPEALARAIREVLDDAALAARLAAGARAVAAHFAWPVIAARHVAHYRELVGPTADG